MGYERFVETVRSRALLEGTEEAERAVTATLHALAQRLSRFEAQALADELPPLLSGLLPGERSAEDFEVEEFYERVATAEGVRTGIAREHAQIVCETLGELLSPSAWALLHKHLPPPWLALFTPPEPTPDELHIERAPRPRSSLSEGRPGSRRPLSEWQMERAQADSVVRADNPHGDTKLSSAHGLTQERERETLAEGRPGPRRPISGPDEEPV